LTELCSHIHNLPHEGHLVTEYTVWFWAVLRAG
jgi:hypothetical protein